METFLVACLLALSFAVLALYSVLTILFHRGKKATTADL